MADDLARAEAWTPRLRELDAENHDLRRRLHDLTGAVRPLLDIVGHPVIQSRLREDEKRWVEHLRVYLELQP